MMLKSVGTPKTNKGGTDRCWQLAGGGGGGGHSECLQARAEATCLLPKRCDAQFGLSVSLVSGVISYSVQQRTTNA